MTVRETLLAELTEFLGEIIARSTLIHASKQSSVNLERMEPGDDRRVLQVLERSVRLYVVDAALRKACLSRLSRVLSNPTTTQPSPSLYEIPVTTERDIVVARSMGRDLCREIGFSTTDQVRVATAISELARNIVLYTPGGAISLSVLTSPRPGVRIAARDTGAGIPNLGQILAGQYSSRSGMGKGLCGTRKLMDSFSVETGPDGTEIVAQKLL
ncbi:ATP-binding protein [Myxococcota bacterium]